MVQAGDATRAHNIHEDAIGLETKVFLGIKPNIGTGIGMDERKILQLAIKERADCFQNLHEGRFLHKHRVKDTIPRVCLWILPNTATGIGSVTDIHGIERCFDHLAFVGQELHMDGFHLDKRGKETE